jgi:ATP-dependent DNA ligase
MAERGYEGLVAKDAESIYRGGATRSWVKVKIRRQEVLVPAAIVVATACGITA